MNFRSVLFKVISSCLSWAEAGEQGEPTCSACCQSSWWEVGLLRPPSVARLKVNIRFFSSLSSVDSLFYLPEHFCYLQSLIVLLRQRSRETWILYRLIFLVFILLFFHSFICSANVYPTFVLPIPWGITEKYMEFRFSLWWCHRQNMWSYRCYPPMTLHMCASAWHTSHSCPLILKKQLIWHSRV